MNIRDGVLYPNPIWRAFPLILTVTTVSLGTRCLGAPVEGDLDAVRQVLSRRAANRPITTWRGSAKIEWKTKDVPGPGLDGGIKHEVNFVQQDVQFAYDASRAALRWNLREWPMQRVDPDGATRLIERYTPRMLYKGAFYRFEPSFSRTLTIEDEANGSPERLPQNFNPMQYLRRDDQDLVKFLQVIVDHAATYGGKDHWTITRSGPRVVVEALGPDGKPLDLLNRYTFDIDKGGNLIEYEGRFGEDQSIWRATFEFLGGSWVISYVETIKNHEGDCVFSKVASFTNNAVNDPVDESEFSLEALEIKPGDYIQDTRIHVTYRYKMELLNERSPARLPADEALLAMAPSGQEAPRHSAQPAASNELVVGAIAKETRRGRAVVLALLMTTVVVVAAIVGTRLKRRHNEPS